MAMSVKVASSFCWVMVQMNECGKDDIFTVNPPRYPPYGNSLARIVETASRFEGSMEGYKRQARNMEKGPVIQGQPYLSTLSTMDP